MSYKIDVFQNEIGYIMNPNIRAFMYKALESLPDYFFMIPASSTGKHHPAYVLGEGGLVRHTKAAVKIAIELFRMEDFNFTDDEKDLIVASLILHDGWKSGYPQEENTRADHPKIAVASLLANSELNDILSAEQYNLLLNNILTHMGQWNKEYKSGIEFMPKPSTIMQKFVHLCDYLASRKCIEVSLDAKEY